MYAMELTEQQKNSSAQLFIQNFPHMTFAKAKTTFGTIQKPVQSIIWKKLKEHDKRNENKLLSTALGLAHLPQELQSLILAETDKPSQILLEKLTKETILELFIRKTEVDEQCSDKNYLEIYLSSGCTNIQYSSVEIAYGPCIIKITKPILFNLTNKHIETINKVQKEILIKEELILLDTFFNALPDDSQKTLKYCLITHYNSNRTLDHNIKFYYRDTSTVNQKIIVKLLLLMPILPNSLNGNYKQKKSTKSNFYYFNVLGNIAIYPITLTITALALPVLYVLSKIFYGAGIATSLIASMGILSSIGIIEKKIKPHKWKQHSINFIKGESIEQFLNDPNIEIKENINE